MNRSNESNSFALYKFVISFVEPVEVISIISPIFETLMKKGTMLDPFLFNYYNRVNERIEDFIQSVRNIMSGYEDSVKGEWVRVIFRYDQSSCCTIELESSMDKILNNVNIERKTRRQLSQSFELFEADLTELGIYLEDGIYRVSQKFRRKADLG